MINDLKSSRGLVDDFLVAVPATYLAQLHPARLSPKRAGHFSSATAEVERLALRAVAPCSAARPEAFLIDGPTQRPETPLALDRPLLRGRSGRSATTATMLRWNSS